MIFNKEVSYIIQHKIQKNYFVSMGKSHTSVPLFGLRFGNKSSANFYVTQNKLTEYEVKKLTITTEVD